LNRNNIKKIYFY